MSKKFLIYTCMLACCLINGVFATESENDPTCRKRKACASSNVSLEEKLGHLSGDSLVKKHLNPLFKDENFIQAVVGSEGAKVPVFVEKKIRALQAFQGQYKENDPVKDYQQLARSHIACQNDCSCGISENIGERLQKIANYQAEKKRVFRYKKQMEQWVDLPSQIVKQAQSIETSSNVLTIFNPKELNESSYQNSLIYLPDLGGFGNFLHDQVEIMTLTYIDNERINTEKMEEVFGQLAAFFSKEGKKNLEQIKTAVPSIIQQFNTEELLDIYGPDEMADAIFVTENLTLPLLGALRDIQKEALTKKIQDEYTWLKTQEDKDAELKKELTRLGLND